MLKGNGQMSVVVAKLGVLCWVHEAAPSLTTQLLSESRDVDICRPSRGERVKIGIETNLDL